MTSEDEPVDAMVYVRNYDGPDPARIPVEDVVAVRVVEEVEDTDLVPSHTDRQDPLVIFERTTGRSVFRLPELVGWDEGGAEAEA